MFELAGAGEPRARFTASASMGRTDKPAGEFEI
jgi:hypothetical protein